MEEGKQLRSGKAYDTSNIMIHKSYNLLNRIHTKVKNDARISNEVFNLINEHKELNEKYNRMYFKHAIMFFYIWITLVTSFGVNVYLITHNEVLVYKLQETIQQFNTSIINMWNKLHYEL